VNICKKPNATTVGLAQIHQLDRNVDALVLKTTHLGIKKIIQHTQVSETQQLSFLSLEKQTANSPPKPLFTESSRVVIHGNQNRRFSGYGVRKALFQR